MGRSWHERNRVRRLLGSPAEERFMEIMEARMERMTEDEILTATRAVKRILKNSRKRRTPKAPRP